MNIVRLYIENIDKAPRHIRDLYYDYKDESYFGGIKKIADQKFELFKNACEEDFYKRLGEILFNEQNGKEKEQKEKKTKNKIQNKRNDFKKGNNKRKKINVNVKDKKEFEKNKNTKENKDDIDKNVKKKVKAFFKIAKWLNEGRRKYIAKNRDEIF